MGSGLVVPAAGTALPGKGTVSPAQSASKLGALFAVAGAPAPPALMVSRTPVSPLQGGTVTYTIVVTNPVVNGSISSLVMSDTLPAGVSFLSLTPDFAGNGLTVSANPGAGVVEGAYGTLATPLAGGSSVTFTLVGKMGCAVSGDQTSTVFAGTGGMCGSPSGALDSFVPGVVTAPGVAISRTPAAPTQGDLVVYTISVTNFDAAAPLNSLTVSDTLPAGLSIVSFSADAAGDGLTLATVGQVAGASGSFTTPLPAGGVVNFTLVAGVGCGAASPLATQAYGETASGCTKTLSLADSFTPGAVVAPSVSVSHVPASPLQGDAVTYQIVVKNNSAVALNSIVLSDTLPAGVDYTSLSAGSDGGGDGLVLSDIAGAGAVEGAYGTFTPGLELAPGASFTFTLTGTVDCAGVGAQSNRAYGETAGGCTKTLSGADSFTLVPMGLSVVKSLLIPTAGATVLPGAPVQYRIVVTNTGVGTLTSLNVIDTLASQIMGITTAQPAGFGAPAKAASSSGSGTVYAWSGGGLTMGPNLAYSFTISGFAGVVCAPAILGNTAYATAGNVCGTDLLPTSAVSGVFTLGPPVVGIAIAKALLTTPAMTGDPVQYRIVITNTGTSTVVGLSVVDTLAPQIMGITTAQPAGFGAPAKAASSSGSGTVYAWSGAGLNMAPGAALTFTITGQLGTAYSPITIGNTAYAGAVDRCAVSAFASSPSDPFTFRGLFASMAAYSSPVCAGDRILVTLTVTNTGANTANGLGIPGFVQGGPGSASGAIGPTPALGGNLASGASLTFTWTLTGSNPGSLDFTATITATDSVSLLPITGNPATTVPVTVQLPGALAAAAATVVYASVGEEFTVSLTVTNVGGAVVTGITPFIDVGPGAALVTAGLTPAPVASLASGAGTTFLWTFTSTGPGPVSFTATAAGSTCAATVLMASSTASATIQTPAHLVAAASMDTASICTGRLFLVMFSVTNTGEAGASAVSVVPVLSGGTGGGIVMQSPAPAAVPGGGWIVLSYTLSGGAVGTADFSGTATGLDANSGVPIDTGVVATGAISVNPGAILDAGVSAPAKVSLGQWFKVALTVTDSGTALCNTLASALSFLPAGRLAVQGAGSNPDSLDTLVVASSTAFVWTYSASGAGAVTFSGTVTAVDSCGALSGLASGTVLVQTPPALAGAISFLPSPVNEGAPLIVTLTVTNYGQAAATGLAPALMRAAGTGAAGLTDGPFPVPPATLFGGATMFFTWTFTGTAPGTLFFSTTVTAVDANSGSAVPVLVVSAGPLAVSPTSYLASSISISQPAVSLGQWVTVVLTVTNTGGGPASGVTPSLQDSSFVSASLISGPTPAGPVALPAGSSASFSWTLSPAGAGALYFSLTATGSDLWTLAPLYATRTTGGTCVTPASLEASVAVSATGVLTGETLSLSMTVTNTGGAATGSVLPPPLAFAGTGLAVAASPPAAPALLAPGASLTWNWTLSAVSIGAVTVTATASGTDINSGNVVRSAPAVSTTVTIQLMGLEVVSLSAGPAVVALGETITVVMTASNTGNVGLSNITPGTPAILGTGTAVVLTGPLPVNVATLMPGESALFVWTYKAMRGNEVRFQAGAATGTGGRAVPVVSGTVEIPEAGASITDLIVYPNPFEAKKSSDGIIRFRFMPANSTVKIFTIAGELVRDLTAGPEGLAEWDGRNSSGSPVVSGVYAYYAKAPNGGAKSGQVRVVR